MAAKITEKLFAILGFVFMYIIPVVLFGGVIPYTQDGIAAGLTKMGYIALFVIVYIVSSKIKEWLLMRPKSLLRALILSAFPIVWWIVIFTALNWVGGFVGSIVEYWHDLLIFIIIGRMFYIISETISEVKRNEGVQ